VSAGCWGSDMNEGETGQQLMVLLLLWSHRMRNIFGLQFLLVWGGELWALTFWPIFYIISIWIFVAFIWT